MRKIRSLLLGKILIYSCCYILVCAYYSVIYSAGWVEGVSVEPSLTKSKFWLPVVTNWEKGRVVAGASEAGPRDFGKVVDYNDWAQTNYCATIVDQNTPNFVRLAKEIESNGFGLHILRFDSDVKEGVNAIQVIPNKIFNSSTPMLATIILPPNFSKTAKYPIYLQGAAYGFNNNNLLTHEYGDWNPVPQMPPVFQIVVRSSKKGGAGAISVLLNCGGHEAFGIQREAFESFGQVIDTIATRFGGDRSKVICFGRSRGGLTALAWGSNPLGKNYKTIAIFAQAAFTEFGTNMSLPPSCLSGFAFGWDYVYRSREALKDPKGHNPADFIKRTTGYSTIEEANNNSGWGLLQKAKENNNIVLILQTVGTKDSWIACHLNHKYHDKATSLGINIRSHFQLGGGHYANAADIDELMYLFAEELAAGKTPQEVAQHEALKGGKYYYIGDRDAEKLGEKATLVNASCIPSSVRIPFRVNKGQQSMIEIVGRTAAAVNIKLGNIFTLDTTIGASGYVVKMFTVNQTGDFDWDIKVDGEKLTNCFLKSRILEPLHVVEGTTNFACATSGNAVWERGWGVDEYDNFSSQCQTVVDIERLKGNDSFRENVISISSTKDREIKIFLNQANRLKIETFKSASLISIDGKRIALIAKSASTDNHSELSFPAAAAGVYLVGIKAKDFVQMKKIAVK